MQPFSLCACASQDDKFIKQPDDFVCIEVICFNSITLLISCLEGKTALRASVNIYNSNIHTKKSVYVTMKAFCWEPECSQFNRVGHVNTLHHCGIMRLNTEYNARLDRIVAPSGEPMGESTCEEEYRPLSLLKAGTSKRTKRHGLPRKYQR